MPFVGTRIFAAVCLLSYGSITQAQDTREPAVVFAASSLTTVLQHLSKSWSADENKSQPRLSFGASATMARQIKAGAPAHLFISANPKWTELLEQSGHTRTVKTVAGNQMVLVVPKGSKLSSSFAPTAEAFKSLLADGRLAIADPATAPAGVYARTYLRKVRLWDTLAPSLAYAQNVRQALRLVERGGLPAFIYHSDAIASDRVDILFTVPSDVTDPIIYKAALLMRQNKGAEAFLAYILSDATTQIWESHGFRKIASN